MGKRIRDLDATAGLTGTHKIAVDKTGLPEAEGVTLEELSTHLATALDESSALTAHIDDDSAAHAATAISYAGSSGLSATTVEAALDELDTEKAPLESPTFTGTVAAPTPTAGDSSTTVATTAFVAEAVAATANGLFLPSPAALQKWRALRAGIQAGERQGRINAIGDSITFGSGSGNPKSTKAWPGRLRALLDAKYGNGGTGIVWSNADIKTTPAYDPRWAFNGTVTSSTNGVFRLGRFDVANGGYVEFTAPCTAFVIYLQSGNDSIPTVSVDGVSAGTIRNAYFSAGATNSIRTGYSQRTVVTEVAAGSYGSHTLRITPAGQTVNILGIEALTAAAGTWSVTSTAIAAKSLVSGWDAGYNDEANTQYGLPLIFDAARGDLAVIGLGMNDYLAHFSVATSKALLVAGIQRQRASGANAASGNKANGDVLLLWPGIADPATLPADLIDSPALTAYRAMVYETAVEQDCALLDMSRRWSSYSVANGHGLLADNIHPNDRGAQDIAVAVGEALGLI